MKISFYPPVFPFYKNILFKVFLCFCLILLSKSNQAQSWKYIDSNAYGGWKSIEFNGDHIINTNFLDSNSGAYEPGFNVLSAEGKLIKRVMIPLFKSGFVGCNFTNFGSSNSDSLVLIGWAYSLIDSSAYLTTILLNKLYAVEKMAFKKIPYNYGIPSRRYSPQINLQFNSENNLFYGSTTICGTKMDLNNQPNLSSYKLPCFHQLFLMHQNGEISYVKEQTVNINNDPNFLTTKAPIGILKGGANEYFASSFVEGQIFLDDSFNIKRKTIADMQNFNVNYYANDLIEWNGYYYLFGTVTYGESVGTSIDHIDFEHNRFLIKKIDKSGNFVSNKLLRPIVDSDSNSWMHFKNDLIVESFSRQINNAMVIGASCMGNNNLILAYSNNVGKLCVISLDSNFKTKWQKVINLGYFSFYNITATKDMGCLLVGSTASSSAQPFSFFAIKLSSEGKLDFVYNQVESKELIAVSPNPFKQKLSFTNQSNKEIEFTLYSNLGIQLYSKTIRESQEDIELSQLVEGMYFYEIKIENQFYKKGILIKSE